MSPIAPRRPAPGPLACLPLVLLTLLWAPGLRAQQEQDPVDGSELVSVRLLAQDAAVPAGGRTWLAVELTVDPGWHVYYRGANDSGLPVSVRWHLPPGLEVGPLVWPAPERHLVAGFLLDHVYHGTVVLLAPLTVAEEVTRERLTLGARVEFLVCEERCLEGAASPVLSLGLGEAKGDGRGAERVAAALKAVPGKPPASLQAEVTKTSVTLRLPGAEGLTFVPRDDCLGLIDLVEDAVTEGDTLTLTRDPRLRPDGRLTGLLLVGDPDDHPTATYALDLPPSR